MAIGAITLFSCRKLYLEPLAKAFVKEIWELRPEGIACSPTDNSETILNGEITYSTDHLLCVELTMDEEDFSIMRNESRFGPSIQEEEGKTATAACLEYATKCGTPFPSEYNWYTANVNIDGYASNNISVRKKGFLGSIFSTAPGMILDISNQPIENVNRVTLNNNSEDPTRIAQVLNYKFFEMIDYPAPKCNYANVTVNGEALGIYAHLEPVKEEFLDRNFGNHTGNLYEGQIVDFVEKWTPRWQAKTPETEKIANPLRAISQVINKTKDDKFLEEISKHLNLDHFITFWAAEIILQHDDGYSSNKNNFFAYMNPNDGNRITLIPWGLNYFRKPEAETLDIYFKSELPRKISRTEEGRTLIKNEVLRILDQYWNETNLIALMKEYSILVQSGQNDPDYATRLQEMENWIKGRKLEVQSMLESGIPVGKENGGNCI